MTNYVLGFMFDQSLKLVALIRKVKPAWQAGKFNGVGGKVEDGETPPQAMIREFQEETGVYHEDWHHIGDIAESNNYKISVFAAVTDDIFKVTTTTEEDVAIWNLTVDVFNSRQMLPNLEWLIPFAKREIFTGAKFAVTYPAI